MTDWLQRAEDAANYLVETDARLAELRVKYERDKRKAKRVHSAIFLRVDGSVQARQSQAEVHPDYQTAQAAEMTSLLEFEKLRHRRDTAGLVIDFWRSYNRATMGGVV